MRDHHTSQPARRHRPALGLAPVVALLACTPAPPNDANAGTDGPAGARGHVAIGPEARVALSAAEANNVGLEVPGDEICKRKADGSFEAPIAPGSYAGLLVGARCDQQRFLTMARVADALGVECRFCHAPRAGDPEKLDYALPTEHKRAAAWMLDTFVRGLRAADGSPMRCRSCHLDRNGRPVADILGSPRDPSYALEWMHRVITVRFVYPTGKRLRCKTCHGGMAPGQPGWRGEVLHRLESTPDGLRRRDASP